MPGNEFTLSDQMQGRRVLPIRELGLSIADSALEPVLHEFESELKRVGMTKLRPRFYLSTEWGVCEGTIAIAIPFYLATPELTTIQMERVGHVEGASRADLLRYLRHEMGHVVNYAYKLFETAEWTEIFGPIDAPYLEDFRLEPFSRRYVRHLPGWYAQKHPDEDWSETFAVWMTPGLDWRNEYAEWPVALAKLQYCDRTMAALIDRDPIATSEELDTDVSTLTDSIDQFYEASRPTEDRLPPGIDNALRSIFEDLAEVEASRLDATRKMASALIRSLERDLISEVYRWTGHFPERTRPLVRFLADRADELVLVYPEDSERSAIMAVTVLVTTLAMNHVQRGAYVI